MTTELRFECPTCLCGAYDRVTVDRPGGGTYVTQFYACRQCTTMFLDPKKYTHFVPPGGRSKRAEPAPDSTVGERAEKAKR